MKTVQFSTDDLYEALNNADYYLRQEILKALMKVKKKRLDYQYKCSLNQFERQFCSLREVRHNLTKWQEQGQDRKISLCSKKLKKLNSSLQGRIRFNKLYSSNEAIDYNISKIITKLKK